MNNEKTSSSDIVEAYRELDSISAVANKLHVSEVKVRRTLITEGLWSSPTSRQVSALLTQGASVPEIANQLNTTIKAVEAYMPYRRGAYDESSPSSSSERSEAYRQRKEAAAKNQIHYSGDSINSIATKEEKKALPEPTAQQLYTSIMEKPPKVMRLRLELSGVGESEKQILRTYGQVKNSVSREILVPAEITLHALHYCIQRAFGWQNSHPHHFEYPDQIQWKLLDTVSDASNAIPLYRTWEKLCGVYYRFPLKDEKDIYWDDDYDGNESIKSWLRKKYTASFLNSYCYDGFLEHNLECKACTIHFRKNNPEAPVFPSLAERLGNTKAAKESKKNRTSIDDASLGVIGQYFQQNLFELLERVPLIDLVFPSGVSLPDDLRKQVLTLTENASHEYHKNKAEFRKHQLAIMDAVDLYHENETAGIFAYNRAYRAYKKLATSCDPEPIPLCNTLLYKYDYGDRWEVRLTCEEVYLTKNGWDYPDAYGYVSPPITKEHILITTEAYDRYNKPVAETLRKSIAKVLANHRPICINADGLSVMDDVGGISGYCDFLAAIHEGPEGDRQSRSDWAKSQGWTGRRQAPENIL